eukprot:scaffold4549_cov136-Isochrysis_galbana.AAC.8
MAISGWGLCSQYKYSTVPSTPTVRQQYGTEGQAGGGSGAQLVGRISSLELRRGRGVRGAKACARLSFRGRRVNRSGLLVFPAAQLQGVRMDRKLGAQSVEGCNGDPGGCCSGQLFAVVVMGGAATPKGVFAALTTHAKSRSSGQ